MVIVYIALAAIGAWVVWDILTWFVRRSRESWRVERHLFPQRFEAAWKQPSSNRCRRDTTTEPLRKSVAKS